MPNSLLPYGGPSAGWSLITCKTVSLFTHSSTANFSPLLILESASLNTTLSQSGRSEAKNLQNIPYNLYFVASIIITFKPINFCMVSLGIVLS